MKRIEISSSSNAVLKKAQRLLKSPRFCRTEGRTLADGIHLSEELCSHKELIHAVFIREHAEQNEEISNILRKISELSAPLYVLQPGLFSLISAVEHGPGIVMEIAIPAHSRQDGSADMVFLDGIQDPGNLGTIIRLSLAAGVSEIALSDDCSYVWSPKVLRAGMGAHFGCRFITGAFLKSLKEETGNECLVADARGGLDIYAERWGERPTIWVFGSEGRGVSETSLAHADKALLIPIDRRVESLNVASAAAICLFEQKRRRTENTKD